MHLTLNDGQAEQLHRILTRAGDLFGDSQKLEKMVACWDDVAARLTQGERTFDLADAERRYLRKACMGARSTLKKRTAEAGILTRRTYRKELARHGPLFNLVLPPKE